MIYEMVKAIISGAIALVALFYGLGSEYSVSVIEYYLSKMDFSTSFPDPLQMLLCYLRMIAFFLCSVICVVSVLSYKIYGAAENSKEICSIQG